MSLKHAYFYKAEIQEQYARIMSDPKNAAASLGRYLSFSIDIKDSNYENIQKVSITEDGKFNGLFDACVGRGTMIVDNLFIFKSENCNEHVFAIDLIRFVHELLNEFSSIRITALSGHYPIAKYEKLLKVINARYVGFFKDWQKTFDGAMHDEHMWQICKEDIPKNLL
jgi:hypothetical protein